MDTTTVLIVEGEPLFSELLHRTLSAEPGLEILATANDAQAGVRLAEQVAPDVVLMDIELPGEMDGIEAALRIKKDRPQTGIVILSGHSDRRYVTSLPLEDSRGWAYLLKQSVPDLATLIRAIEGSKSGMVVLDPAVVAKLRPKSDSPLAKLTPRQREVLELLAQGYSNAAIARRLALSEKSVETYVNVIYQSLHLSNEPEIHARVRATIVYLQSSQSSQ